VLVNPATVIQWHRQGFRLYFSRVIATHSLGPYFCNRVEAMGIKEVVTAPQSP